MYELAGSDGFPRPQQSVREHLDHVTDHEAGQGIGPHPQCVFPANGRDDGLVDGAQGAEGLGAEDGGQQQRRRVGFLPESAVGATDVQRAMARYDRFEKQHGLDDLLGKAGFL